MGSDGKYQRTRLTVLRSAQTRLENRHTLGGRKKEGNYAPRPITLPPMPWDKKDDAAARDNGEE